MTEWGRSQALFIWYRQINNNTLRFLNSTVNESGVIYINPNICEAGKSTRFNSETARIAGRKGGKAKAEKEKRLADFGEAMTYFLTNGGIVIDGDQYDYVSAICLRLIQKVIEDGDVSAFKAIVEIIDKHNDKNGENDDDNVLAFIEAMRHNGK